MSNNRLPLDILTNFYTSTAAQVKLQPYTRHQSSVVKVCSLCRVHAGCCTSTPPNETQYIISTSMFGTFECIPTGRTEQKALSVNFEFRRRLDFASSPPSPAQQYGTVTVTGCLCPSIFYHYFLS